MMSKKRAQTIDIVQFAGQRGGEIKTKAIHMHLHAPNTAGYP